MSGARVAAEFSSKCDAWRRSAFPLFVGLAAFAIAPENSSAQAADDNIVVTGSRLPGAEAVNVSIDEAAISARRATDVLELVRQAPGVSLIQPGGGGGVAEVFLRGAEPNFTIVLVDGVRMNDASNNRGGGYDFSTVDPEELARIEIVETPLSAIYGSDAMAGVINLITRAPGDESTFRIRADAGEGGEGRLFLSWDGPVAPGARAGVSGSLFRTDGAGGGFAERAIWSARFDVDAGVWNAQGGLRRAQRRRAAFPDASGGALYAASSLLETADAEETSLWARAARRFSANWTLDLTGSYFVRDETIKTPAIAPGVFDGAPAAFSDSRFERTQVTIYAHRETSLVSFGAGVDLWSERGRRDGALDFGGFQADSDFTLSREAGAVFGELRYAPSERFAVDAALRVDGGSASARASQRLSARWDVNDTVRLRATFANGHKAPSFYALGDTLIGNSDLADERSDLSEVSLLWRIPTARTEISISAFRARYQDLIDFDFATFQLVNRSELRVDGVEVQLNADLGEDLCLLAHFTNQSFEGEPHPLHRPERDGGISLAWTPGDEWTFQADANFVGARASSSIPTGPERLDAYETLDLTASKRFEDVEFFVSVKDVFDEETEDTVGFVALGRRLGVGVRYRWPQLHGRRARAGGKSK